MPRRIKITIEDFDTNTEVGQVVTIYPPQTITGAHIVGIIDQLDKELNYKLQQNITCIKQ